MADAAAWVVEVADEAQTERLGRALAEAVRPGLVIGLDGPLGAGKTRLVQAIAGGLAVPDRRQVRSPTFVLVHEYEGRLPIYHFDAYRLDDPAAFADLGIDEYFASGGICLVEWAGRVAACLPADRLAIAIEILGPEQRRIRASASGPLARAALDAWQAAWVAWP